MKRPFPDAQKALYLAIDQGGHAVRAMVFDDHCHCLCEAHEAITLDQTQEDYQQYDPNALLSATRRAIASVIQQLPEGHPPLRSAALATQRANIVCWNRHNGAPLSPVISWQDRRGASWLQTFTPHAEQIQHITGLFLSPHYGASKLRWCLDNLPAVRTAQEKDCLAMGPLASFLIFHLLREQPLLSDPVNASRTQLWDLQHHDWSPHLLALFGLPATALPRCVPTRHSYGTLYSDHTAIPLTVVTGDQAAALFSHGEPDPDTIYITMGTGAFIQRPIGTQPCFTSTLLSSVLIQEKDVTHYTLEGTVNGAACALEWLEETLGAQLDFDHLAQWLEQKNNPPLFLNGIAGLGTPFMRPDFPSRFVGGGSMAEKACGVIESIVFLIQMNLENMQSVSGPAARIVVGGGLARLDGLCQRIADLSALPVLRVDDHETTSRGLAWLLTGCASGEHLSTASRFSTAAAPALNDRYRQWRQIMSDAL